MTDANTPAEVPGEAATGQPRPILPIGLMALVLGPIVIGLLLVCLLVTILWLGGKRWNESHERSASQASLQYLCVSLKTYEASFGVYPPALNTAVFDSLQNISRPPLSPSGEFLDHWGRPWVYKYRKETDRTFRLYSIGPNGVDEDGKGDDISVEH
ncbi:MAG: type II secretion system protein GspG [Planctomycetota bacterium]|mgnify:CR=1 FL=1